MSTYTITFCNVSMYHQAMNFCAMPFQASQKNSVRLVMAMVHGDEWPLVPGSTKRVHEYATSNAKRNADPIAWETNEGAMIAIKSIDMSNLYASRYAHRFHLACMASATVAAMCDRSNDPDNWYKARIVDLAWVEVVQHLAMLANA